MGNLADGVREEIGARIKEARLAAGLSRPELARRIGFTRPTVHRWETGEITPSAVAMERVAATCGVTMRWLTTGKVDAERQSSGSLDVFRAWLKTPRGQTASPMAIAFMEAVPIAEGVVVDPIFYDLLLSAYEAGVRVDEAAQIARGSRTFMED